MKLRRSQSSGVTPKTSDSLLSMQVFFQKNINHNNAVFGFTSQSYDFNRQYNFRLKNYFIWKLKICVILIHDGAVREAGDAIVGHAVMPVDMAEQMQARNDFRHSLQQFFGAVVDAVVEVEDAVRGRVSDQHVDI